MNNWLFGDGARFEWKNLKNKTQDEGIKSLNQSLNLKLNDNEKDQSLNRLIWEIFTFKINEDEKI